MDVVKKRNSFVSIGFMILFFSIIVLIYLRIVGTPIDQHALEYKVQPNLDKSFSEILLASWHSEIAHWRMPISNWFYHWWGINEFTYKLFPILANFCTLLLIYNWTKTRIGETEAVIAAFLFGISYYNIWITVWVHFAEFYMFASFLTILFLMKGCEKEGWKSWWVFAVLNFLNITNTILPFLFQPVIPFVAGVFGWATIRNKPDFRPKLKRKVIQFFTTYSASLIAALIFYQIKGINFLQNTFDLLTKGKFVDKALLPIATKTYSFEGGSTWDNLVHLSKNMFVTQNFENHDWIMGHPFAHWLYLILFLAGMIHIAQTRKTLFGVLISIFVPPFLILGLLISLPHGRFLIFALPFYLICVATGFVWLVSKIGKMNLYIPKQEAVVYILAFFLFSWILGFPKPVWSNKFLDESFHSEGFPSARDHLLANIKPNDVILNITNLTELRSEVGDTLTLISLPRYFKQFFEKHRMKHLVLRKGNVGVWLILDKPLSNPNVDPFYFPRGYKPQLVLQKAGVYLYHGNMNLPDPSDIKNDRVFTTPFWSFIKGYSLQEIGKNKLATLYYGQFLNYGINTERAHFNLGLMLLNFSYDLAMKEFSKALEIIETPTHPPEGVKVESISVNEHDESGMAQKVSEFKKPPIRYYYIDQNGYRLKFWFKEDLLKNSGHIYSPFYFFPGVSLYNYYANSNEKTNLERAALLIDKGFQIDNYSDLAKQVYDNSSQFGVGKKVFLPYVYCSLLGVFDPFPPVSKTNN
jgi:hypothetical protein